ETKQNSNNNKSKDSNTTEVDKNDPKNKAAKKDDDLDTNSSDQFNIEGTLETSQSKSEKNEGDEVSSDNKQSSFVIWIIVTILAIGTAGGFTWWYRKYRKG